MKVYNHIEQIPSLTGSVVTIGTFDGLHSGHQEVIRNLISIANKNNTLGVVISFNPHPRVFFDNNNKFKTLSTFKEKIELFRNLGLKHLIILPFSKELADMSFEAFAEQYIVNILKAKVLVLGYDHHFGNNREGNYTNLLPFSHKHNLILEKLPPVLIDGIEVSSTKIRNALSAGDITMANRLLAYNYFIDGKVVQGNKLGRKIGYPTVNILLHEPTKQIPAYGVYAVKVNYDGFVFQGMMNIGIRPTINKDKETIEVNIFDFDKDIYDENLRIFFVEKIREEIKFETLDALRNQLDLDKIATKKIFNNLNN